MPKDELRGLAFTPCELRNVNILQLSLDAFHFMSHITLLRTSEGKGNGHDNGGICKGKQHRSGSSCAA